jgi:hypothetical protein
MIRSNPTAIPLRASDLKLLQAEIEKRRSDSERARLGASAGDQAGAAQTGPGGQKDATAESKARGKAKDAVGQPRNAVEENRRRREGMTAAERIGLA